MKVELLHDYYGNTGPEEREVASLVAEACSGLLNDGGRLESLEQELYNLRDIVGRLLETSPPRTDAQVLQVLGLDWKYKVVQ